VHHCKIIILEKPGYRYPGVILSAMEKHGNTPALFKFVLR